MLTVLFIFLALVLWGAAFYLFNKTDSFLPLINEEFHFSVSRLLKLFGILYFIFGFISLAAIFIEFTLFSIGLLFLVILSSAILTTTFAQFIGKKG